MNKEKTIELLEAIVELEGNCLKHEFCKQCPFKKRCLPTFLRRETRMSSKERLSLVLNFLTNSELLDNYEAEDCEEYFANRDR